MFYRCIIIEIQYKRKNRKSILFYLLFFFKWLIMKSMSNVDIYTIVKELNEQITGARVDKAYQPSYDTIRIKLISNKI